MFEPNKTTIPLSKIPMNQTYEVEIDSTRSEWVQQILDELNENASDSFDFNKTFLNINLKLQRLEDSSLKEHVSAICNIEAAYAASCVRCLDDTLQNIALDFEACLISSTLESDPLFKDSDSVVCFQREMPLYFYEKKFVNMYELIHEQIYLNLDQTPICKELCEGLCQICGENLNHAKCNHGK